MSDLESFFMELKKVYAKERRDFVWDWEGVKSLKDAESNDLVQFMAFNLAKDVLHGPLPDPIHSRMVLEGGEWVKKYVEFLER